MGILNEGRMFHLDIRPGDVGEYCILCGDPGRVPIIAAHLENSNQIAYNREFRTYAGYLGEKKVGVVSTGIGGPSTAIAVEELVKCGAHTFIRVGTSGGMVEKVAAGDLVIASSAIRGDGTSYEYLPPEYPAVADFHVTSALWQAGLELSEAEDGSRVHVGVVQSKDSFYGETNPETMPISEHLQKRWQAYLRSGCLTSEMECATLFAVGLARGVRTGAVLTAIWNVERSKNQSDSSVCMDSTRAIKCAIKAVCGIENG